MLSPLVGRGDHELVDDHLTDVREVAELRLPAHQRVARDRVAVLEAQRRVLRQHGVVHHEARLVVAQVVERLVLHLVGLVDEHAVPLAERAAPGVLPGQPHGGALEHEAPEGE